MSQAVLNSVDCPHLTSLLADVGSAVAKSLHSLIDKQVDCPTGELGLTSVADLRQEIPGASVIIRGSLGEGHAGKFVRFVIDTPTATTLAASMMMIPMEAIQERSPESTLSDEELEALGDVANVICSGAGSVIRKQVKGQVELRLTNHESFDPDSDSQLGDGSCVCYRFPIVIEDCPQSMMHVILDIETAELLNGQPLDGGDQSIEEPFEDIPEAPIRGTMAAYVLDQRVLRIVRRCCRRVGLELDRYADGAIPNPAAHRGQIVLMDVPSGEESQFDWCERLVEDPSGIKTVLIIHDATKSQVLRGFKANADAILGWPLAEALLSQKVAALLDPEPSPEPDTAEQ
jgi:chemotaxis protein CheY-P-specific phosphatase CheC